MEKKMRKNQKSDDTYVEEHEKRYIRNRKESRRTRKYKIPSEKVRQRTEK